LEAPDLGNEDGAVGNERTPGRPTTRRYSPEEKSRAVRLVRQLRKELGASRGTIQRVADQIGCGVESLRSWVKQADIDEGVEPGVTSVEAKRSASLSRTTASCVAPTIC
jgi:transposase